MSLGDNKICTHNAVILHVYKCCFRLNGYTVIVQKYAFRRVLKFLKQEGKKYLNFKYIFFCRPF